MLMEKVHTDGAERLQSTVTKRNSPFSAGCNKLFASTK